MPGGEALVWMIMGGVDAGREDRLGAAPRRGSDSIRAELGCSGRWIPVWEGWGMPPFEGVDCTLLR